MGLFSFLKDKFKHKDDSNAKYDKALEKSRKSFSDKLGNLSKKYQKVNQEYFEEVEEILIEADVGISLALSTIEKVLEKSKKEKIIEANKINELIIDELFSNIYMTTYLLANDLPFSYTFLKSLLLFSCQSYGLFAKG